MKFYLQICLTLLFSLPLFSQNTYYLEGKLGKSTIFMEITEYDNNYIEGNYFYQKSLKDIRLNGKFNEATYVLFFGNDYGEEEYQEKFELLKTTNDFSGKWKNKAGKTIAVQLKKIDFNKYNSLNNQEIENNLDLVKLSLLNFTQDSISTYKNQEIIWLKETHCNAPFFRLGKTFSEETKKNINTILAKTHTEMTLNQLSCSSPFSYNEGNGIEYSISIGFLNDNLLGYQIFSSYFCGGAHPDFGGEGNLIDMHTGKNYDIDSILAFDKSVTSYGDENFEQFSTYRATFFAPKLFKLINQNEKFGTSNNEDDYCDYTENEIWDFPQWNFTEKGIEFTPVFARVARSCEMAFLVDFEKLKPFKNPSFPYTL
ncbi:hypothetical protein FIA58_017350 [Flavobacterium jejuense]|uniref:DUF3298 domain-containing protein n=1 Tax=Flavobacterium jejuense TaxID=1544455 RepID=A0ABX0IU65_9FLAO|nr:hypothetical protein [Flavobacterium jejuense]NHN27449.1 hypothetical protein [Flavobacterium jejuense]